MKNQQLRKLYYHIRHQFLTTNNLVIVVALFIAASWAIGSVQVLQRNYALQSEINGKQRQLKLAQLETDTLRYQQAYYKSDEYKELAIRQRLGLVFPGEKVLILPPNSAAASASDAKQSTTITKPISKPSNFEQWMRFLFSGGNQDLQQ